MIAYLFVPQRDDDISLSVTSHLNPKIISQKKIPKWEHLVSLKRYEDNSDQNYKGFLGRK